jgi:hypothetical protein
MVNGDLIYRYIYITISSKYMVTNPRVSYFEPATGSSHTECKSLAQSTGFDGTDRKQYKLTMWLVTNLWFNK